MVKETKFNQFLSFSFAIHILLLLLFSFFSVEVQQKEIPLIEVSLLDLKMEPGGKPLYGRKFSRRFFTASGVTHPFRLESPVPGEVRPHREYSEPAYNPVSSVPSIKGDMVSAGWEKKSPVPQGMSGPAKKGPELPSGSETSRYAGERLGIAGPAASRGVLYFEYPSYPEWAQKRGIEARVKLKFWVEPEGNVEEVIVERRGYLQLDNIAIQCLKKWRFEPLAPGTSRTRQWGTIEIIFTLKR